MCLAVPGRIVTLQGEDPYLRTGRVDFGGLIREVSLALVPEAQKGDHVLVHAGMALSVIDEAEAQQVFEYLQQMLAAEERGPDRDGDGAP